MARAFGGVGFVKRVLSEPVGLRLLVGQRPRPHLPRLLTCSDDLRRLDVSILCPIKVRRAKNLPFPILLSFEFVRRRPVAERRAGRCLHRCFRALTRQAVLHVFGS